MMSRDNLGREFGHGTVSADRTKTRLASRTVDGSSLKSRTQESVSGSSGESSTSASTDDAMFEHRFQRMTSPCGNGLRTTASCARSQTEKLQSIMAFLDESRESLSDDAKDKIFKTSGQKACSGKSGFNILAPISSGIGAGDAPSALSFLDDQEALILSLRLQLNRESERALQTTHQAEEATRRRLKQQKDIYESKLRNVQLQITQLADEKKLIGDRCETLAFELKQHIVRTDQKLADQEKRNQENFKNAKIQWDAAEKTRRQKWIAQRAQEIKESTLRSVEPEIQHVLDLHKDEIRQMQEHFESLVQESDTRSEQKYCEKLSQVDDAVAQRIEDVRQQERELAADILTDKLREVEKCFRLETVRREEESRVSKEITEERLRLQSDEIARVHRDSEEQRQKAVHVERVRTDEEKAQLEARHKKDMKKLQTDLDERFSLWKDNYRDEQEAHFRRWLEKEQTAMRTDRDREIAKVMSAMSDELATLQVNLEKTSETRVTRLQERHQLEIDELNSALETWKLTCQEVKEQSRVRADLNEHQKARHNDLECRLAEALRETDRLEKERRSIAGDIKLQYSSRTAELEDLLGSMRRDLVESEQKYTKDTIALRDQTDLLKREHDIALETINDRVHDLLKTRDAKIEMLRKQFVDSHQQSSKSAKSGTIKPVVGQTAGRRAVSAQVGKPTTCWTTRRPTAAQRD